MTSVVVGTDLVQISRVAASIARFGDRFVRRMFTADEIVYCTRDPRTSAERYAARFAAKEATLKVLRPEAHWLDWRTIEIVRMPGGWCELALHGTAKTMADDAKLHSFSLSMSHEGDYATAVVLAQRG